MVKRSTSTRPSPLLGEEWKAQLPPRRHLLAGFCADFIQRKQRCARAGRRAPRRAVVMETRARSRRRTATPGGPRGFRLARWRRAGGSVGRATRSRRFRAPQVTQVRGRARVGAAAQGPPPGAAARWGARPPTWTLRPARGGRPSPGSGPFWPPLPWGKPVSGHTLFPGPARAAFTPRPPPQVGPPTSCRSWPLSAPSGPHPPDLCLPLPRFARVPERAF